MGSDHDLGGKDLIKALKSLHAALDECDVPRKGRWGFINGQMYDFDLIYQRKKWNRRKKQMRARTGRK